ncbi:hypothetical protein F4806DRAFT_402764 [Annulohypoxylon nitens]|nr:hypothetical protein F4806DRAFT_402764 [Annulohypoxylon nitens]
MATKSPPNVGTPDIDDKMTGTSSPVSPRRQSDAARDSAPSASPGRRQALAEVSANATRTSSAKVSTATPVATTNSSTSAKQPSGVMRTQRQTRRHNPLERHDGKGRQKKKVMKQGTDQQNIMPHQPKAQDQSNGDGLNGVEAGPEDLVSYDPNDDRGHWASEIPNLLRNVKHIAWGLDAVRGIHDDTEEGLMFLAGGIDFD